MIKAIKLWLWQMIQWVTGPLDNAKPKPRVRQSKVYDEDRILAAQHKRARRRERNINLQRRA